MGVDMVIAGMRRPKGRTLSEHTEYVSDLLESMQRCPTRTHFRRKPIQEECIICQEKIQPYLEDAYQHLLWEFEKVETTENLPEQYKLEIEMFETMLERIVRDGPIASFKIIHSTLEYPRPFSVHEMLKFYYLSLNRLYTYMLDIEMDSCR
jgi:hypothetical protein